MASTHHYCTSCGAANQVQDAYCFACGRPLQGTTSLTQYPNTVSISSTSTGFLTFHHLLKQRYHILEQLGQGGFGAVYKAEDTQFGNRLVAVKEMSQSDLNSQQEIDECAKAFKHEALMLAGLRHQNLPRIYDHFSDGGRWYLVMDFIEGETLEEHLQKTSRGYLSIQEILQIGMQLCTVLDYLHTRQPSIIFRDLKPSNLMLTSDGHLYLIDFGIARHFKPGKTKDTIAFGSPGYASPEQYGKAQTTPRSDIYSLGAILHRMLTGIDPSLKPFQFVSPNSSGRTVPSSLSTLVMQMLEMDETRRPARMNAIKQELQYTATQPAEKASLPIQPVGRVFVTPIQHSVGRKSIIAIAGIIVVILVGTYSIFAVGANHNASSTTIDTTNTLPTPSFVPTLAPTLATTPFSTTTRSDLAGQRLQFPGQPQVYLIDDNGTRRWIPNQDTYNRLFRDWNGIIQNTGTLGITPGPDISTNAYLAKDPNATAVYLIDNGYKRWITSPAVMDKFNFDWNKIQSVSPSVLSSIPDGPGIT